ncbi:MAG: hypothetical protein S4CHLAM2_04410 [Chlamydiales bacterium]|nr:hypothetical protein [Chlamydiales bacterium]
MFGMESDKKKNKVADYSFDLEVDLKDPGKLRAIKEQVEERVTQLKTLLRQGEDKKSFDQTQTLLHGYLALQKVVQRSNRKMF